MFGEAGSLRREKALLAVCLTLCTALGLWLLARGILRDAAGMSNYAALADAFLHGRLDVASCPEGDCAVRNGKTYVIFPPLPAWLIMPVVAFTGAEAFRGMFFFSLVQILAALFFWSRMLPALGAGKPHTLWLVLAMAFASPLFYVALKGNGVWFAAQASGFLFMTLAIAAIVLWRSLFLAALFVALAILCRQMAVFYPLFLYFLFLKADECVLPDTRRLRAIALAALPVVAVIAALFAYNFARFGAAFDTGYGSIVPPEGSGVLAERLRAGGLFSPDFVLFNLYYLFMQGFHAEFGGPAQTSLAATDMKGAALLIASPWLALLFYTRLDRAGVAGLVTIAIIAGITLFYHSNGMNQVYTQRYALDWIPIAMVLLARVKPPILNALPLVVTIAIAMNTVALGTAYIASH